MGPDDPWSPGWRPDDSGERLRTIRTARRGALLAGSVYLPVAVTAALLAWQDPRAIAVAMIGGLPGVALLGAGLAPSVVGDRRWAVVAGLAFAIGAPVAAVASLVIAGFIADTFIGDSARYGGPFLRASVTAALRVWPLVALATTVWIVVVRRFHERVAPRAVPD